MSASTLLPSLNQIDLVRLEGYRPTVVACLIFQKKVLLVFKKRYQLWLLPQGGVDNGEDLSTALVREMREELGQQFATQLKWTKPQLLFEDRLKFVQKSVKSRDLKSDQGEALKMKGKHYYVMAAWVERADFNLTQAEFDKIEWANYSRAKQLFKQTYLKNKKVVLEAAIESLKKHHLIE